MRSLGKPFALNDHTRGTTDKQLPRQKDTVLNRQDHRHIEPLLVLMCGVPFAGKTTLARALATQYGWQYIALDAINTERGVGLDGKPIPAHEWDRSYAEAYRRVATALQAGMSVVYDETNFARTQRNHLRAIAAQTGSRTTVVYVATPEAEARRRWLQNRICPQRSDVRDADFAYVVQWFEPPTADEEVLRYDPDLPLQQWMEQTFAERLHEEG